MIKAILTIRLQYLTSSLRAQYKISIYVQFFFAVRYSVFILLNTEN